MSVRRLELRDCSELRVIKVSRVELFDDAKVESLQGGRRSLGYTTIDRVGLIPKHECLENGRMIIACRNG